MGWHLGAVWQLSQVRGVMWGQVLRAGLGLYMAKYVGLPYTETLTTVHRDGLFKKSWQSRPGLSLRTTSTLTIEDVFQDFVPLAFILRMF